MLVQTKVKSVELLFSSDGQTDDASWVPLGSLLEGGTPIIADGPREGDDREFLNKVRITHELGVLEIEL